MPDLEQQIAEAHSDLEATGQSAKQLEARLRIHTVMEANQ